MGAGEFLASGVGELDTEGLADDVKREPEIAAGDASVVRRVVGQFGDEKACRVQGSSQERSCSVASSRARRAPRGVGESCTLKLRTGVVSSADFWFTSLSVASCAYREK
ncbi:hypothetical protein GCM10022384_58930 [Streptomyces marokkonensis]|uniref:Uncharacterized protein n=1 Tax=Streptomyces marokkonensis TaxID=324855 RepID=A0ABP7S053_9ACTN